MAGFIIPMMKKLKCKHLTHSHTTNANPQIPLILGNVGPTPLLAPLPSPLLRFSPHTLSSNMLFPVPTPPSSAFSLSQLPSRILQIGRGVPPTASLVVMIHQTSTPPKLESSQLPRPHNSLAAITGGKGGSGYPQKHPCPTSLRESTYTWASVS